MRSSPRSVLLVWQAGYPWEIRLGKMIGSLKAEGYRVALLCRQMGNLPAEEDADGVTIVRVGAARRSGALARSAAATSLPIWFNPLWSAALTRLAARVEPDLIVVRDIPLAVLAAKVAQQRRIPVLLDMAEHYPEAMRSWDKYAHNPVARKLVFDWKVPDWVESKVVPRMDGIMVVCDEQKERLMRDYGYPGNRIAVVLNTPDLAVYAGVPRGTDKTRPCTFGYHGILCRDRELETVVRGFEIAAERNPDLRLLLCGDGESAPALQALAKASSVADRIEMTGRYTPAELPDLYAKADFGIVSLRVNEFTQHTLANKFFDYAALGKPFIFTRVRPLENAIRSMRCGVPFNGGDPSSVAEAMESLYTGDYASLSKNGIERVERRFNWSQDEQIFLNFVDRFASLSPNLVDEKNRRVGASI
jgi:glycosyltransferase involved in cell wall biosynthesis